MSQTSIEIKKLLEKEEPEEVDEEFKEREISEKHRIKKIHRKNKKEITQEKMT